MCKHPILKQCFFLAIFCNLVTKKKGWQIQPRDFGIVFKNSPYLDQKNLEVAKFR
jgi:hypothetical protein